MKFAIRITHFLVLLFFILVHTSFSQEILFVDGFDYPIGNRGYSSESKIPILERLVHGQYIGEKNSLYPNNPYENAVRWGGTNLNGWANYQDVGSYYGKLGGIHPGEDWNKYPKDFGENIYAIANGQVVSIRRVNKQQDLHESGYLIVLQHFYSEKEFVYSIYVHVTSAHATNGQLVSSTNDFTINIDDWVKRGELIAKVAKIKIPHLHLEIRKGIQIDESSRLWPNGNGKGYYSDKPGTLRENGMILSQVRSAFDLMSKDGVIDPSDYIDNNRVVDHAPKNDIELPKLDESKNQVPPQVNSKGKSNPQISNLIDSIFGWFATNINKLLNAASKLISQAIDHVNAFIGQFSNDKDMLISKSGNLLFNIFKLLIAIIVFIFLFIVVLKILFFILRIFLG